MGKVPCRLALGGFLLWEAVISQGQILSPYSAFQAMSVSDLQTAQVKLTYLGTQVTVIPSVGLAASKFDNTVFIPFRRTGINYFNEDFVPFQTGTVSGQDINTIINNVAALPNVTAGGVSTSQFVSFSLSNTVGGAKVFEAILNPSDAAALFNTLRSSLLQNVNALAAISTMACPTGLLDPTVPSDVTSSVQVSFSGFRLNRASGQFVGTATVLNASSSSILSPLSLVVQFGGSVQLANASGATCGTTPTGILYINLSVTSGGLGPASSSTVTLSLANPNSDPIQTSLVKVLSGAGSR